jgi:hypothetical protein
MTRVKRLGVDEVASDRRLPEVDEVASAQRFAKSG